MAKKAAKRKEDTGDEAARKAIEATPPTPTVSKAEGVRRAIAAGVQTPAEGVEYVMKHFGIEMDNKTFSLNRSQHRAREAKQGGAPKGKPGRKPKNVVEGYLAPPPKPRILGEQPDLLAALKAMKPLVAQLGADKVHEIVDLLG
jgi:hypothetical protein